MTILKAIAAADRLRPNDVGAAQKRDWLSALDGQLALELLEEPFAGYDAATDAAATELLAPPPWDLMYPDYLCMRIDLATDDLARYENDRALFEASCGRFARQFRRSHTPPAANRLRF